MEAVDERQEMETLRRDEKTTFRTLKSQKDKFDQLKEKKSKLTEDAAAQTEKREEVGNRRTATGKC